jgi:tetratricopeptide (TPR) repeat protein
LFFSQSESQTALRLASDYERKNSMGRRLPNKRESQIQQLEDKIAAARKPEVPAHGANSSHVTQPVVPYAWLWLATAFLLPNIVALRCDVAWGDDAYKIIDSLNIKSLSQLAHIWISGYWGGEKWSHSSVQAYRPLAQTVWALTAMVVRPNAHAAVVGPFLLHLVSLVLGLIVVLLLYKFLLTVETPPLAAFISVMLFALFPIHTEATTSIVGSAETLAAALGLCSLLLYYRNRTMAALLLFALAVASKESAVAFAALPLLWRRRDGLSRDSLFGAVGAGIVIAGDLVMHRFVVGGNVITSGNPMAFVSTFPRILTALWVQCMYLSKTLVPVTLVTDYSFNQIPIVFNLADWRGWVGLALAASAVFLVVRYRQMRVPILCYAFLFSPTSNVLFPIGTDMGERLAYAPSIGVALALGLLLARYRHWRMVLLVVALVFATRTVLRNRDWVSFESLVTQAAHDSPDSAYNNYALGILRQSEGDGFAAVDAYDRAIDISPEYAEAYCGRAVSFEKLDRRSKAVADFKTCERLNGPLPKDARAYIENNWAEASSKSPKDLLNIAIQRREAGDAAGAVSAYSDLIDIMPEYAPAYCNRGVAFAYLGRRAEAITDFRRCQRDVALPDEVIHYIQHPEAQPPAVSITRDCEARAFSALGNRK